MNRLLSRPSPTRALQAFQLLRFGTVFLTGIVLARSGMSLKDIGIYESLLFISSATGFFWVNGLGNSLTSRFNPAREKEAGELVSATFSLITTGSSITAAMLWIFREPLYSITGSEAAPVFGLFCLYTFFNNASFLNETLLLIRKRANSLFAYGALTFLLHTGGAAWIVLNGQGIEQLIQWLLALAVLKNVLLIYQLYGMRTGLPDVNAILYQAKSALPLILSMLISGSAETIDGFLVGHFLGNESFAVFRYGARELPLSGILAAAFSQAMVARFAAEGITLDGLANLKKESKEMMHLVFPVSILLILFSSMIFPLVFGPEFLKSSTVFNIYALLVISRMVFPQTLVMALGRHDAIFRISLVELALNITCSVALLPWLGMEGIALGTLIAFLVEKGLLYRAAKRHSGIQLIDFVPIRTWLVYTLLLLLAFTFTVIR